MIHLDVRLPLSHFELDLRLDLEESVTALFGPSGVGKTTLLETIAGLRRPARGEITIDGAILYSSSAGVFLPPERRRVGYVPQDALLFPHLSVAANIGYGDRRLAEGITMASVAEALEIAHLLGRRPDSLSGGERQRVALARALVTEPRLLLLDEPLAALDVGLKERVLPYLSRVRELYSIPSLVVSHDVFDVLTLCDEVVVLSSGSVVERGTPRGVLSRPGSGGDYFRGRFENVLDAKVVGHEPEEGLTEAETERGLHLCIPYRAAKAEERVLLGVFAEDILLATRAPEGLSARNVIEGNIEAVEERQGTAMVRVLTPDPIYVRLTHGAVRQLGLSAGQTVQLIIKTHSIHRLG